MKLQMVVFDMTIFFTFTFITNTTTLCEKVVFSKTENINQNNYSMFHDSELFIDTLFVRENEIINILNYGMNMRRLRCL
jgi:uncharacterized membrane protein